MRERSRNDDWALELVTFGHDNRLRKGIMLAWLWPNLKAESVPMGEVGSWPVLLTAS